MATPVTIPALVTVATARFWLVQVTVRPAEFNVFPDASISVSVSAVGPPTATVTGDGATVTVATGANEMLTVAVPLGVVPPGPPPGADAVMVADCVAVFATVVTNPVCDTLTAGLLDDQTIVRPGRTTPPASFAVAVSCTVCPSCTVGVAGVTVTVAIGTADTLIVEVACTLPLEAVMVVAPLPTAVTVANACPDAFVDVVAGDTLAAVTMLETNVTVRPESALFDASRTVTVICCVCGTLNDTLPGVMITLATGIDVTVIVAKP